MPSKTQNTRTPDQQQFWDDVFMARWPQCVAVHGERGDLYCLHLAAEFANHALAERRMAQEQHQ